MIRWLHISNFQRHKRLRIKLDPHITTIVGPSDVGKSSVLRAVRWALLNEPRGAAFQRHGSKHVSAELRIDKHIVKRSKGKRNTYRLDGRRFHAFGNGVPQEVAQLLNVSELNFQGQHDSPFWFSKTAGEVSKQLNAIVDLAEIDGVLAKLAHGLRTAKGEQAVCKERLRSAVAEKRELRWTLQANKDLKRIEKLDEERSQLHEQVQQLEAVLERAISLNASAQSFASLPTINRELAGLERLGVRARDARQRKIHLELLIEKAIKLHREADELEQEAAEAETALHSELGEVCPLCGRTG
jgi:DNA repair exonuclease SbcCD ATPase subunit